jgi:S-adenosylmethionine hydrolase
MSAGYGRKFSDVGEGELVAFEDSSRQLALAVNRGSAAERLALATGDQVRISVASCE